MTAGCAGQRRTRPDLEALHILLHAQHLSAGNPGTGVSGLRLAHCSIMPEIASRNTDGPSIMVGEKASDLILEDLKD